MLILVRPVVNRVVSFIWAHCRVHCIVYFTQYVCLADAENNWWAAGSTVVS